MSEQNKSEMTRAVEALERLAVAAEEISSFLDSINDSLYSLKDDFENCVGSLGGHTEARAFRTLNMGD